MAHPRFFLLSAEAQDNKNSVHQVASFLKQELAGKSPALRIGSDYERNQAGAKRETAIKG